ncbi:MAG: hypothetical protein Q9214_002994 [Letrouitia sp. 1 TL-2023]
MLRAKVGVNRVGIADTVGCASPRQVYDLVRTLNIETHLLRHCQRFLRSREIEDLVADAVAVNVPFNNYITGACAFTHKAGIHAKAILNNPSTYEIWNAIKSRVDQLGIQMTDDQIKLCTAQLKALADVRRTSIDDADSVIRRFHFNLHNEHKEPLVPGMTTTEQEAFREAHESLSNEAEGKHLMDQVDQ